MNIISITLQITESEAKQIAEKLGWTAEIPNPGFSIELGNPEFIRNDVKFRDVANKEIAKRIELLKNTVIADLLNGN